MKWTGAFSGAERSRDFLVDNLFFCWFYLMFLWVHDGTIALVNITLSAKLDCNSIMLVGVMPLVFDRGRTKLRGCWYPTA